MTACSFSDDFNDGSFDAPWSPYGDVGIHEGQVHMTLTPNAAEYHGLFLTEPISVRECGIWLEMLEVGQAGENGDVYLQATLNGDNGVSIGVYGDRLTAWEEVNGAQGFAVDVPYDRVAHRWWMLREAGGKVFFETSPDGRVWTAFATHTTPDYFNQADVQAGGCTWNPVAEPGEIVFDNVNVRVP